MKFKHYLSFLKYCVPSGSLLTNSKPSSVNSCFSSLLLLWPRLKRIFHRKNLLNACISQCSLWIYGSAVGRCEGKICLRRVFWRIIANFFFRLQRLLLAVSLLALKTFRSYFFGNALTMTRVFWCGNCSRSAAFFRFINPISSVTFFLWALWACL